MKVDIPDTALKPATKSTGRLVNRIELAIGIKVMVMLDLSMEADIANGTRGIIQKLILNQRGW